MSALGRFLRLSWTGRLLVLEALLYLAAARAALAALPFRRLAAHLGRPLDPVPTLPSDVRALPQARRVASAVELTARRTPWESACLAQAIAAKLMLRRRRIASLLCLGTRMDETGKLVAHAWLLHGNEILLGGTGYASFTLLTAFGETPA